MRVMSLDASTSTIGVAILDNDNGKTKLFHQEYYKPPGSDECTIFERLLNIKKYLIAKLNEYKPDEFVIEDIVMFMRGKSGAKTIIPLALFNRTLGLTYYEWSGKLPHLLNVLTIRHCLKFSKELPAKEDMPQIVAKHLGIPFPYYYKTNKKTKLQEIMEESMDVADAISVGLAFIFINVEKRPKIKYLVKKRKK